MSFYRILLLLWFLFPFGSGPGLDASPGRKIIFSYVYQGQVYQGSFRAKLLLRQNGEETGQDFLDFTDHAGGTVSVDVVFSKLEWARRRHDKELKLVLGTDLRETTDNLTPTRSRGGYDFHLHRSITISYRVSEPSEVTAEMLMHVFAVTEEGNTYEDIENSEIEEGKILGLAISMESFISGPRNLLVGAREELEMQSWLMDAVLDGLNSKFAEFSEEGADAIRTSDYESLEANLRTTIAESTNSTRKEKKVISRRTEVKDYDLEKFSEASQRNTKRAYRSYLNDFPEGRFRKEANNKILDMTPFHLYIKEEEGDIYKNYHIDFVSGVGNTRPHHSMGNNLDRSIREEWQGTRSVTVSVPRGRSTDYNLRLGRKDTTLFLAYGAVIEPKPNKPASAVPTAPTEQTVFPPTKGGEPHSPWKALVLAIPFLAAIFYLVRKNGLV